MESETIILPELSVEQANPWVALPENDPYILPNDLPTVEAWNVICGATKERMQLRLDVLPEPFSGPRDARVLVLGRNPGWAGVGRRQYASPFGQALRRNFLDEPSFHLNVGLIDGFARTDGGIRARRMFRALTQSSNLTFDDLSRRLLSVAFHGYHSHDRARFPVTMPGQSYGFELVRKAVERGAVVVILGDRADWQVAVPELLHSPRVFPTSKNGRTISPVTLGPTAFEQVVAALGR
jgi:hypothetical protein